MRWFRKCESDLLKNPVWGHPVRFCGLSSLLVVSWPLYPASAASDGSGDVGVSAVPLSLLSEDFENGGAMPDGWTQTNVTGSLQWVFQAGGNYGEPDSAYSGSYNALLYCENYDYPQTILSTPPIDFGVALGDAQLTFWHYMDDYFGDQDELRVYYKTSAGGAWTLLATYTSEVKVWTQQTVSLPNPGGTYYVGFEGTARFGFGICIDDVEVTGQIPTGSFAEWAETYCPGMTLAEAFVDDRNDDGVQNGFEYAFGTNWTSGTLLLSMASSSGVPVVDIPRQTLTSLPYADIYLEMTSSLSPASWSSNGIESVTDPGMPANRFWFKPAEQGTNAFFRLKGTLR